MFKRQKEVVLYQLSEEEKVIRQLERQYRKALEDVEMVIRILMTDEQTPSKINRINYQKRLQAQLEGVLEALHNNEYKTINAFLQDSYTDSFVGTMYDLHGQKVPLILPIDQNAAVKAIQLDTKLSERKIHPNLNGEHVTLYESLGVDVAHLKKVIRQEITRGIATGMDVKDIARNISMATKTPRSRAKAIARTESHRIQESSKQDARTAAKAKGTDVVKHWDSTMDGDTRPDHRALDGQIREVDEYFEVPGKKGKRAKQPGGFGKPADDCNCRCIGLTRARAALDEEELKVLEEKAAYWKLDKAKDFADFKEKYLKAAETLNNQGESGIIKEGENYVSSKGFVIHQDKIHKYLLKPGAKHYDEFLSAGYSPESPEQLIQAIEGGYDETKATDRITSGAGVEMFCIFMELGTDKKKRFRTVWQKDTPESAPRLITAHKETKK